MYFFLILILSFSNSLQLLCEHLLIVFERVLGFWFDPLIVMTYDCLHMICD